MKSHDKGNTFKTIVDILTGKNVDIPDDIPVSDEVQQAFKEKLNYWIDFKVLKANDFGIPQRRERIFIVGFDKDQFPENTDFDNLFEFPEPTNEITKVGDILENLSVDNPFTISEKLWASHQARKERNKAKGNGFGYSMVDENSSYTNTLSVRYYKDGSEALVSQEKYNLPPRMLTPRECARLQAFPENFIVDAISKGQAYKQFGNSVCVKVVEQVAQAIFKVLK